MTKESTVTLKADVTISGELYAFLMGEGPMEGMWFGDMNNLGAFWWRALLLTAKNESTRALPSPDDGLVERVARAIVASFEKGSPDIAAGMRMDWQTWIPEAKAALASINETRA
jgi:hypothetical protein